MNALFLYRLIKMYNCVNILSYQFILIKRTGHKPLHLFWGFSCVPREYRLMFRIIIFLPRAEAANQNAETRTSVLRLWF